MRSFRYDSLLVAVIAGVLTGGVLFALSGAAPWPLATAEQSRTRVPTLAPILRAVTPAVVSIIAQGHVKAANPLFADPFFRQFVKTPAEVDRAFKAGGSGVVIDAAHRYVLTSNHVVDNATDIAVTTKDNHVFHAEVVVRDLGGDIALLRLDGTEPLTALPIGDSGSLQVGDFVMAIGNPFGVGQSVTLGIVSAVGRGGLGLGSDNLIQTDASINPGNSGGALIDLNGRLVGINSAILASGGGNLGIGFAVPINATRNMMATVTAKNLPHLSERPASAQSGDSHAGLKPAALHLR